MVHRLLPFLAVAFALAAPATAAAAPPNDARTSAQPIPVPGTIQGTTSGSTLEANEPSDPCASGDQGSVWYRVQNPPSGGVVVRLHADGDLDGTVQVLRQVRSRLDHLTCDPTDDSGDAATAFRSDPGGRYLIRVAQRQGSASGTYTLRLLRGPAAAEPPGRPIPRRGGRGRLDRVLRVDAAWSTRLRAGRSYRFNLVHGRYCMPLELYPPGIGSFDQAAPVKRLACGGYGVYTPPPGVGGRYVFRILADRSSRNPQPYALRVGRTQRDDLAPGVFIGNYARRRGIVDGGGLDDVDVYRFDVRRRSALDLDVSGDGGALDLELKDDLGRPVTCACSQAPQEHIAIRVAAGRYFVAVRSRDLRRAHYVLRRQSRTSTRTATRLAGHRGSTAPPRTVVPIAVSVGPAANGPALVAIEHLDPFEGWLPARQYHVRVRGGRGLVRWRPPSVGRWRARTDFFGSRLFAPSASRFAYVLVAGPLRQ